MCNVASVSERPDDPKKNVYRERALKRPMLIGRYGEYVPAGVPLRCRSGACDHLHLHSFFTLFAPSTNPALGPCDR